MPQIKLIADQQPLTQRIVAGLRYPLHGAALTACTAMALSRFFTLLPNIIGAFASILIWIATWRYAIDCLTRTANGYANPPEVSLDGGAGSPQALLLVHVLLILLLFATSMAGPEAFWTALILATLLLPAIDMSLAFDGSLTTALHPLTWASVIARFGVAYLVPVLGNAVLATLVVAARHGADMLPALLAIPVYGFACTWLVILEFHWMGLLIWHYRERLGMQPEAPELAASKGQHADDDIVRECEYLARSDPEAAAAQLRDYIRDHHAPPPVHTLFRRLMHQLRRDDILLQHGQFWIAQLCANDKAQRALGVVQECREIDPDFLPENPHHAEILARTATRIGMRHLAGHLARGFIERWPRHEAAAELRSYIPPAS